MKRRLVSGVELSLQTCCSDAANRYDSGFELFSRETLSLVLGRAFNPSAFFPNRNKNLLPNLRFVEVPINYRAASPRLSSSALADAFKQLWRLFQLRLEGHL